MCPVVGMQRGGEEGSAFVPFFLLGFVACVYVYVCVCVCPGHEALGGLFSIHPSLSVLTLKQCFSSGLAFSGQAVGEEKHNALASRKQLLMCQVLCTLITY